MTWICWTFALFNLRIARCPERGVNKFPATVHLSLDTVYWGYKVSWSSERSLKKTHFRYLRGIISIAVTTNYENWVDKTDNTVMSDAEIKIHDCLVNQTIFWALTILNNKDKLFLKSSYWLWRQIFRLEYFQNTSLPQRSLYLEFFYGIRHVRSLLNSNFWRKIVSSKPWRVTVKCRWESLNPWLGCLHYPMMYENVARPNLDVYQNPFHYNFYIFAVHDIRSKA